MQAEWNEPVIRCTTMRWRPIAIASLFALAIDAGVIWIGRLIWKNMF
jgi:hypothetical protein